MNQNPNIKPQISPQNRFMPPHTMPNAGFNMPPNNFPVNKPVQNTNVPKKQEEKKGHHINFLDTIQNLIQNASGPNEIEEEKKEEPQESIPQEQPILLPHHHDDTGQNTIWSGFITKSKQNRVGVDALLIQGEESILYYLFNSI